MMRYGILILFVVSCSLAEHTVQFPKGFKRCYRDDPERNKCFVDAANIDYHLIKDGYAPLGLPPVQGLKAPPLRLAVGDEGVGISFTIQVSEGSIFHTFDKFTSANINLELDNPVMEAEARFKNISWFTTHNTTGKFLVGTVKGHGKMKAYMWDIETKLRVTYDKYQRDGETYWSVKTIKLKFKPKRLSCDVEGLVENKQANAILNKVLNDNWEVIFPPQYPILEGAVEVIFRTYFNTLLSSVPVSQMWLETPN